MRNLQWFLVLPEPTVTKRRHEYASSLRPQIDALVDRAEALVALEKAQLEHMHQRLDALQSALKPALPKAPQYRSSFKVSSRYAPRSRFMASLRTETIAPGSVQSR